MLDGNVSFVRRGAGSYVEAARIVETPIASAILAMHKWGGLVLTTFVFPLTNAMLAPTVRRHAR